jgi:3-hydroxyisobutyrate dehydrogenase-like beta-hydroxyacid dehydrogenase
MSRVAFLGLGLINKNLAIAAAARGDDVVVWNRSAGRVADTVDAARSEGLVVVGADSVGEAVSAFDRGVDRVHVALSDDDAVDAVLSDDVLAAIAAVGAVVVDHTTTAPDPTAARGARLRVAGVAYLHAPVFMAPANCRAGTGLMLLVGDDDVVKKHHDALAAMTQTLKVLGPDLRRAAALKLFGNAGILGLVGIVADICTMAKGVGMSAHEALEVFSFFSPMGAVTVRGPKMAAGDFTPSFELSMARKDVRLMMETAGDGPLAVLPSLASRMDVLLAEGHGALDVAVLAKDAVLQRSNT